MSHRQVLSCLIVNIFYKREYRVHIFGNTGVYSLYVVMKHKTINLNGYLCEERLEWS
jgi:hypothetical protein